MPLSQAIADSAILHEMATSFRQHISAAILECSAMSRDLRHLDADKVMSDIVKQFDLHAPSTALDAMSEAFYDGWSTLQDAGIDEKLTDYIVGRKI